jgi:alkanesulfonate monooxygenase SsuD/methylene tetrahydromethanopterin reductase-like flavin-dependent oxidoreductase (luciferase family)
MRTFDFTIGVRLMGTKTQSTEAVAVDGVRLGANLWSQASDWPAFLHAGMRAEELGFDHLWTWDHLLAIFGEADQPIFEGYAALAALAASTSRIRIGLFVGANTFRSPALAVKAITTIDHISSGRAVLGIGGAWFELEHRAFGLDFGTSVGQRLDWLAEAAAAMRGLLDGEEVTSPPGGRYAIDHLRIVPLPLQAHLPIMVGGTGERKTLRIVAERADIWNAFGTPEVLAHKDAVLREHCAAVGRDPAAIERTVGCKITIRSTESEAERVRRAMLEHNRTPLAAVADDETFWTGTAEQVAETMVAYRRIGFHTFIVELGAPYDDETMETLVRVVKPMVESVPLPA